MAAEAILKKPEQKLSCPVCLDIYTDPKQLQCHHIYCQKCLGRLVVQDQQRQPILTCPNCRQVTPVPARGVAGLPAAFPMDNIPVILATPQKDVLEKEKCYEKKVKDSLCPAEKVTIQPQSLLPVQPPGSSEKLCTPALTIDGVKGPYGVAISSRGEVVVAEWGGKCVTLLKPNGKRLRSFGSYGSGQGQFKCPTGVAVDADGNILVTDCHGHRIQKFSADGQFLAAVGARGSSQLEFHYPMGVAVNKINNKVYVVDSSNERVQVLNSDLTFSSTFGTEGTGEGQFKCPQSVACDCSGTVYVSDNCNLRIQVFTADGKFQRMFQVYSEERGKVVRPCNVAIGNDNMVYVNDVNDRMTIFTSEGQFVTSFVMKRMGKEEFNFSGIVGVAVDGEVLYVCDHDHDHILSFPAI